MITDNQSKLPIDGVQILVTLSGGERTYSARTDGFGMFRIDNIESGTYNLAANHPGYHSGSDSSVSIATDKQNRWQKELTHKEPFFDLFVEVGCVTTGMKLKNVPVRITATPTDGGSAIERTDKTDDLGFIQFTGLPRGGYSFAVNEGAGKIPGWTSYSETVSKELTGPHWADVLLKPETSYIISSVYGFNPVTEENNVPLEGIIVECEGVHPDDPEIVLAPVQTGVSGIRKENNNYWDNTMAGKVRFAGLPHISWIVQGKRLGYKLSETKVTAIPEENLRIDMALQDTKLTVVVNTPYNDPEMLAGLKVRLQGLKDSNTAGIDRIRTVEYQAAQNQAVVVFDKILPGSYLTTVADMVTKTVPIIVDGVDIQAGKTNPSNRFSVRFTHSEYIDAFADVNHEAVIFLEPAPLTLTGHLNLSSINGDAIEEGDIYKATNWHTKSNQKVEIRASAYYSRHMPEKCHLIEVTTDDTGAFTVSLLPGLYGFAIPDMDDYWGGMLTLEDLDSGIRIFFNWPYYQEWPYSKKSADSYIFPSSYVSGGIGGIGFSSGQNLYGRLGLSRKQFVFNMHIWDSLENDITRSQVIYLDGSNVSSEGLPVLEYREYLGILNGGILSLSGPENLSSTFYEFEMTNREKSTIVGSVPGTYTIAFNHPDYELKPGSLTENTLEWYEFPNPGILPHSPFPENYGGAFPLGSKTVFVDARHKANTSTAYIEAYGWRKDYYDYTDQTWKWDYKYLEFSSSSPHFISFSHTGNKVFGAGRTSAGPSTVWHYYAGQWYKLNNPGGNWTGRIYIGGPSPTEPLAAPLSISYDLVVEARNNDNKDELIKDVVVVFRNGTSVTTPAVLSGMAHIESRETSAQASHPSWSAVGYKSRFLDGPGQTPVKLLTLYMQRGNSLQGEILNGETGKSMPGTKISITYGSGLQSWLLSKEDGTFSSPSSLPNTTCMIDVRADGFAPYRKRLNPGDAAVNPDDPRAGAFIFTGNDAIKLTPLKKPVIFRDSLTMNRRGAFLPGAKKAGNQTVFNSFNADGPLTMTWTLDVGLAQKEYTVNLPGFDNADGSAGSPQSLVLQDGIREVWLIDMKSFPHSSYNDEPVPLTLPEALEPAQAAAFLKNICTGAEGFKNVYYQRLTNFTTDTANPDVAKVTGKVKLWQLPPDQFNPAFMVVTKLGAVNVYSLEYTGNWAGKELTGARLPPWFAGMADIMGSVAGSQAMLGDGIKNALPRGKIIALPTFKANVVLRATNALDYVYSIDTQIKEGMQSNIGGIMGLAPGFMGLSIYGGVEATLKGEDREFYLQLKGGIAKKSVNQGDYQPGFLKKLGARVDLRPPPAGEVYRYDSYKFDPDNRPDELAVLYGVSGQVGAEISASIFPVLKYIPKVGPVLFLLYKSGAVDIRALTKGLIGVRSMSGFKTTFPHQEEHDTLLVGQETKQWRRHFLGGNEVGDPVKEATDSKKLALQEQHQTDLGDAFKNGAETLDIAFGFGVGMDMVIARSLGAKATIELSGDDAWTGAPAMLIDINPNGDWPIVKRVRGDLRAVLEAYLQTWVARFQKKWHWKAWPIDYQFGTESVMKLIEMEITTQRRDLATEGPLEFKNESPVILDKAPPIIASRIATGAGGDMLLYTDMAASGRDMVLKASLRTGSQGWGQPVVIAQAAGTIVNADIIALAGGGWLAVWTQIDKEQANVLYPPSKIMYTMGNADGASWTLAALATQLGDVAGAVKLIPHGPNVALVYTETKEGPSGNSYGIDAMVWNQTAWSIPQRLVSGNLNGFDALGSGNLLERPSLISYNNGDSLHLIAWTEQAAEPLLLKEGTGNALAFTQNNARTYLAYSGKDGGIGLFQRDGGTGPWTDQGFLFPDAVPRELSLAAIQEDNRDLIVIAWTQSDGQTTNLYYGTMAVDDETLKAVTKLAASGGDFRQPAFTLDTTDGALELTAMLQKTDGINQLHAYRLSGALFPWGDINNDGLVDLQDFIIILRILVNGGPLELPGTDWADVNRNGKIDPGDVIYILRILGTK
ncbi:MAG: carboxypeptidase regulatory-like domain-containing protein [Proteobacteria bacterium]|nr:carboxypeptidase regulatory-like domain-containing protein [Pseudomonadota bacterium]